MGYSIALIIDIYANILIEICQTIEVFNPIS